MKEDRLGDEVRLQHILTAIGEINQYTQGVDFSSFERNSMMLHACIRQLEIIGEASNRISAEKKEASPEVAWAQIISLRNLLIHAYFGVNPLIIWEIIQNDLPPFHLSIQKMLTSHPL